MADSYFGKGISLASGFDLGAELPLDARVTVDTFEELNSHVNGNRVYPGLTVYVKDRDENYQYDGKNWVLFGRGSVSTVIVDKYEDIANLKNVGQGALIYVKSDVNKNGEENMYVVTKDKLVDGQVAPEVYVALSTFAKSQVPTLRYDESVPEGKNIYLNKEDELILKFFFSSDTYGDGKFRIWKNGALVRSFDASKGNVLINMGAFDVNGEYKVEVAATDYFGTPAPNNLLYKVIVGGLDLSSTFDETILSAIYEVGDEIKVPYVARVGDKQQKIKTVFTVTRTTIKNGVTETKTFTDVVDSGSNEVMTTWNNKTFFESRGLYHLKIQAYTGESLTDTTEGTFISNILEYDFRVLEKNEIGVLSNFEDQTDTNVYVSIPFKLTRKNTAYLTMRGVLKQKQGNNWVEYSKTEDTGITVACNTINYWPLGRLPEGEYQYEISGWTTDFGQESIDSAIAKFKVVKSSYQPVMPVTSSLIAWFDANDRRNNDDDKNIWENKKDFGLDAKYRIELHDLNYDDNGWKHIDGLADNINGEFILKMNGQAWGQMVEAQPSGTTIPYSPFSVFTNKGAAGITIEAAFKTRCNGDLDAKVLTCMEGRKTDGGGAAIGYNQLYLSSRTQPMAMDFMEDEWVHVALVIDRDLRLMDAPGGVTQVTIEDLNPTYTMRIYIDGVLCSCSTVKSDESYLDALEKAHPLMLNACYMGTVTTKDEDGNEIVNQVIENFGECEIKFIRVYNRPLKASDVVQNYISHIFDPIKQRKMKDRNDPAIVSLPSIVFNRKVYPENPNKNTFNGLHRITVKAESKKYCVPCTMEFRHVDGRIDVIDNIDVYLQGTSSLQYPVKNYQIKHYNFPTENASRKKEKITIPTKEGVWVPDHTYTLKCDYMEQSHRHNTPTAKFYDHVVDALGGMSPAREGGFRDSIDGFPCIVYYNENPGGADSKEVLVGSFMFNIDKEGAELGFDLRKEDENGEMIPILGKDGQPLPNKCISYEGTANTSDTAGCFFELGDNIDKVYGYYIKDAYETYLAANKLSESDLKFEAFKQKVNSGEISEFKTFEQYQKDYSEIDYIISDFEARYSYCEDDEEATYTPMLNLVNWVSSCWEPQADGEFKLNKKKFESGFETHFDMKYMLAYYLQMQVFAQVDNCGKNCMWDTWDGIKFYPRPYDMDTSMGLTNSGEEKIRVDAELIASLSPTKASGHEMAKISNSNTDGADRYLMFNTKTSRLWNAFAEVYAGTIADTYKQLRLDKIYTYEYITSEIDKMTIDEIGEVYYNKDAGSKYLKLTNDSTSEFLTMLHGNRTQKYKKFLKERLIFLDTIYGYQWAHDAKETVDTLNSETRMRSDIAFDINTGKTQTTQCHLGISVYSPQYVKVSIGSDKDAVVTAYVSPWSRYKDPDTGVEKEGTLFSFPIQGTNKEIGIFGSGNIKSVDRLETLDLTSISAERLNKIITLNLSGSTRLSTLGLGQNTYLRELDCSRAQNLGTDNEGKTLDLSNCKNLQKMNVSVTKLTGVVFPRNTNLISCDLSYTKVAAVNIDGAEFLTDIKITGCEEITDFSIQRCNKLKTLNISNSAVRNCKANNCRIMTKVDVSNCTQLESFDASNSDMIEELIMTNCNGSVMKDLQLYSLYNLKKLYVNGSKSLHTIRFPKHLNVEEAAKGDKGKPWDKLTHLDVSNSTVMKIQYGSGNVEGVTCDMSKLVNLEVLKFNDAGAVTDILNLNYTAVNGVASLFANCFYLKRITGEIRTSHSNASSIFYRCHILSDISKLTFVFRNEQTGKPCITNANSAFYRCARATTAMLKKFLDACGESLITINDFINMWGVDTTIENGVAVGRGNAVLGTEADRGKARDIPSDLFLNTPNIQSMSGAFTESHYKEIPGNLFDPIKDSIKNLSNTFVHCDKLERVGKDLLKNKKALENCYGTFAKCYNLKYYLDEDPRIFELPENVKSKVTTTNQMFFGNSSMLVGDKGIEGLFDDLTAATTFEFMFCGCSGMSMKLTNGLFANNKKLAKLDGIFVNCSKITELPDRLFRKDALDTNEIKTLVQARNVFSGCSKITGTVKKTIFEGAPELTDISSTSNTSEVFSGGGTIGLGKGFFADTNVTGYHEDILKPLPKLINANNLFYHSSANASLRECLKTGLQGDELYLNSITPNLFKYNKSLQGASNMFCRNTGLIGHIPSNLFDSCRNSLINVSYMFRGCTGLNGTDNDENDISGDKNVGISNLWFKNCKALTYVNGFLYDCDKFMSSEIPEDLFAGCTSLQNTAEFFYNCSSISGSIPRGLFDDCRSKLTTTSNMFYNCRGITGELPTGQYTRTEGIIAYEMANQGEQGALLVVEKPTDFTTQVSYNQVILTSEHLKDYLSIGGYVRPIKGVTTKVEDGKYGLLANCLKLTSVAGMFNSCQAIKGAIPYDLFYTDSNTDRYLNLTNVNSLFANMFGLNKAYEDVTGVKYICNEDFFAKCPALTNVSSVFYRLYGLPACNIYPNMFRYQSQITDASNLFYLTSPLTGAVPRQFLSTCLAKLQWANGMFDCCNMTSVDPQFLNLGSKNTILKAVGCIFHANFDQKNREPGSAGTAPAFWDVNMFPNLVSEEKGRDHAFAGCTLLTNYSTAASIGNGFWVSSKSH